MLQSLGGIAPSEAFAASSGSASKVRNYELLVHAEDEAAVSEIAKTCGKDPSCFQREISSEASQAKAALGQAVSSISPTMDYVLSGACATSARDGFAADQLCRAAWISELSNRASWFLSSSNLAPQHFDRFLRDAAKEKPQPWYLAVFNKACAGSSDRFGCFQGQMAQIHKDASAAAPSAVAYLRSVQRGMMLTRRLCQADPKNCGAQGLSLDQVSLSDQERAANRYSPRGSTTVAASGAGGASDPNSAVVQRGAAEGVAGGAKDCGKDAQGNPIDCDAQALVVPRDLGWEVEGPVASCPDFLKPFNCLGMGTGLAGNLTTIRNAPYFAVARERMCRERLRRHLDGKRRASQRYDVSADPGPGYLEISKNWGRAEDATEAHSPGCRYLIEVEHQADPAPPLTREEIDTARVSGNGKLHETLMNLADIASESGLQRDLGAYSVQQQALGLLQVKANLDPRILTEQSPAAFDAAVEELLGAASCLSASERSGLESQFQALRAAGLSKASQFKAEKPRLDAEWAKGLAEAAQKAEALDRENFDLSLLWSRLHCGGQSFGSASQCLKYDYRSVVEKGREVSPEVYAARERWIREDLGRVLAEDGQSPDPAWARMLAPGKAERGQDASCLHVSCDQLAAAIKMVRRKHDELVSGKPLLGEPTGRQAQRRSCGEDPAERNANQVAWSRMKANALKGIDDPLMAMDPEAASGKAMAAAIYGAIGADETACQKPETLADALAASKDPARQLEAARAAAARVHADGLGQIRAICGKPLGLEEEGAHAAGVQQISQGFLSCKDVGEYSRGCADRRSFGWALCRFHMQHQGERNTERYKNMFVGMAMASGGALAVVATAGGAGVVAGALGLGMTASGVYMRHAEIASSRRDADYARRDFRNQWASYKEFASAWKRMKDAEKNAIAADVFDGLASAMDAFGLVHALKLARTAGKVAAIDRLIKEGKAIEAFDGARKLRMAEESLALAKRAGAGIHGELLDTMRGNLRAYGPRVMSLPEKALATLDNLEERLQLLLDEGLISKAGADKIRSQVADRLGGIGADFANGRVLPTQVVDAKKLIRLEEAAHQERMLAAAGSAQGGATNAAEAFERAMKDATREVLAVYHDLQASGRFHGAAGARLKKHYLDIFEDLLRVQFPNITDDVWRELWREKHGAILEGRITPQEAFAARQAANARELASQGKMEAQGAKALGTEAKAVAAEPGAAASAKAEADLVLERVGKSPEVSQMRERHKTFTQVSDADNQKYIEVAYGEPGVKGWVKNRFARAKRLYFEVENSILKQLNDGVLKDKELVNAVTNRYKEILFEKVGANPLLKQKLLAQYSDYKSLRLVFSEQTPEVLAELNRAYNESAKQFAAEMEGSPLKEVFKNQHGIARNPGSWHLAGIASTADEASAATRSARNAFRESSPFTALKDFSNVKGRLSDRLRVAERIRTELQSELGSVDGLMSPARQGSSKLVLSDDALEVLRKVEAKGSLGDYIRKVQEEFKLSFGVELTPDQALNLRDYQALADGFSSSVVLAKPVVIDLGKATAGIVSVDFAGQGARNIRETMAHLAESSGKGTGAAVKGARQGFHDATRGMVGMNDNFKNAVTGLWGKASKEKVFFSGDDGIFLPNQAVGLQDKKDLVARLAATDRPNGYRVTFLPQAFADTGAVIPAAERGKLVVMAEGVEKKLRSVLKRSIDRETLKNVGLGIDFVPDSNGGGTFHLIVGGDVDEKTLELIRENVAKALPDKGRLGEIHVAPKAGAGAPHTWLAPQPGRLELELWIRPSDRSLTCLGAVA